MLEKVENLSQLRDLIVDVVYELTGEQIYAPDKIKGQALPSYQVADVALTLVSWTSASCLRFCAQQR